MAVSTHRYSSPTTPDHQTQDKTNLVSVHSEDYKGLYQQKFEEVRQLVVKSFTGSTIECLQITDTLQHLAIDYHFRGEIESALSNHYKTTLDAADDSLCNVLLSFRLLRQNGYLVSPDFFKGSIENFGDKVTSDLNETIGLYEASQFVIDGEELLEQVNTFTSKRLRDCLPLLNQHEASRVSHNLNHPSDKTLTRFNLKNYIKSHQKEQRNIFQEFAKMDFNLVQSLHRQELQKISLWWNELGLAQKLRFARDQPVKWYMWSMATLEDPILSEQRIQLTKPIALIYLMDDIFDCYGTLEELVLFTEAIHKWELQTIKQLPYPMKVFLKALYDLTEEISDEIHQKYRWNPINSLNKAWKLLCNAFLVEAQWFASGDIPGSEEYLQNGVISSGVHVVFVHMFFLLGEGINRESVNLVDSIPGVISHVAKILRLWDDLGNAKDENQQGHDGSFIECYRKEHEDSTIENAREHVRKLIANSWKELNKEYLSPTPFSLSFKKASLNAAKMVRLMYSYDANQRLPSLEKHIKSLLFESISLAK